jgi:hypothetical protein
VNSLVLLSGHPLTSVNHGEGSTIEEGRSGTRCNGARDEISRRWDAQTRLDEAVAAIRSGDANRAIALAEGSALKTCDRSVLSGLLALMVRCEQNVMLDYVRAKLTGDPTLAQERYAGRALLHEAAVAGALLDCGPDIEARDGLVTRRCGVRSTVTRSE